MIRSSLFNFFFFSGVAITCILAIPCLFFPSFFISKLGKALGYWLQLNLRIFLNCKIKIRGLENLVKKDKFFVASAHQSIFETFYLQTIIDSPIFILKKELFKIPLFGLFLKKMGCISIVRNTTTKENIGFFDLVYENFKKNNRPLIIFPQGTRTPINEKISFKKGVGRIYEKLNIKCLPIALNSDKLWPKIGPKKNNIEITISILNPIDPGMEKDLFIKNLEKKIYDEIDLIK
tara:strand:- start:163 stop:864 length:702 start_codon:yes stop_codon:yes gene_type:complete